MIGLLLSLTLSCANADFSKQIQFGRFQTRGLYSAPSCSGAPAPLVIMVPGSGPSGPEEMTPGQATANGQPAALFNQFGEAFRSQGMATFAIGKPGIEFFTSWDPEKRFYDESLFRRLTWSDLVANLTDAVEWAARQHCVDLKRILILGHSEGTQVAIDFARGHPGTVKGLILVGYFGDNLAQLMDWQLFRRPVDLWLAPDVDRDRDGYISRVEASAWPEFKWDWLPGESKIPLTLVESTRRNNLTLVGEYQEMARSALWQSVFYRSPVHELAATMPEDFYLFTGTLDAQTPPGQALKLMDACRIAGKVNCHITLLPGLGHGMSEPRRPRQHQFLDMTLGPASPAFLRVLTRLAREVSGV